MRSHRPRNQTYNAVSLLIPLTRIIDNPYPDRSPLEKRDGPVKSWPEYWPYTAMLQRCRNENSHAYDFYGGRGIGVCDRWIEGVGELTGFETFVCDMGLRPSGDRSIDRIDNDGDYTPDNCRWATPLEQSRNNRNCRMLTHQGKTQSVTEWCEELGLSRSTVYGRLDSGRSVAEALTSEQLSRNSPDLTEREKRRLASEYLNTDQTAKQVGRRYGASQDSVYYYARKFRQSVN